MAHNHDSPANDSENYESEGKTMVTINLEDLFRLAHPHPEHDPGVVIRYRIRIDDHHHDVKHRHMTGESILALVNKDPAHFQLEQSQGEHGHAKLKIIKPDEVIDFTTPGIEKFITSAKPAKVYTFFIDQKEYKTEKAHLTVREILTDFAHVDTINKELVTKQNGNLYHYKNLDEVVSLEHSPKFTLFDLTPAQVS